MTIEFDSNLVLSKKEREERVLDLHFNENKNCRQIAKEVKMSIMLNRALFMVLLYCNELILQFRWT
jgi:hypothetical protein